MRPGRSTSHALLALLAVGLLSAAMLALPGVAGARTSRPARAPIQLAGHPGTNAGGSVTSFNWAGYAATGSTFQNAQGTWVQPAVACSAGKPQFAAFWVGLDGYLPTDNAVEQIGTDSDCVKPPKTKGKGGSKGKQLVPSYYAWFEMFPQPPVFLPTGSYPVAPGDQLTATVSDAGGSFTLTLVDNGKWTFSTQQATAMPPPASSAEWVVESPSTCTRSCKSQPLSNFGTVAFSSVVADGAAVASQPNVAITMVTRKKSNPVPRAVPSPLGTTGADFTVSWRSS
ncbi:MAG TPA: G1 family glutamic endopeptidase [Acidimicrobiales bacterium]|nr:G1 family glutamic endopeptidase [Acidimicrobiales bacterium]